MSRGNRGNRGNGGNNRGSGNNNRGNGRGRGASPFRGQGWRGQNSPRANGRGRGGFSRPAYTNLDLLDYDIQQYTDVAPGYASPNRRGIGSNRGKERGRGRGRGFIQEYRTFRGSGRTPPPPRRDGSEIGTPQGRASGMSASKGLGMSAGAQANMPLWKLLSMDRPYLRPINFVPAQITPVLFQREEEILEVEEFIEPEDHVPTAAQVTRVFSHQEPPLQSQSQDAFFQAPDDPFDISESEQVMTIDFNSIATLLETSTSKPPISNQENITSSILEYVTTNTKSSFEGEASRIPESSQDVPSLSSVAEPDGSRIELEKQMTTTSDELQLSTRVTESPSVDAENNLKNELEDTRNLEKEIETITLQETKVEELPFVLDPNPDPVVEPRQRTESTSTLFASQPLGSIIQDDEETIIYEAPNPRSSNGTPLPVNGITVPVEGTSNLPSSQTPHSQTSPTKRFDDISFSFSSLSKAREANQQQYSSRWTRRVTKKDRKAARKRMEQMGYFSTLGAALEERHLHEEEMKGERRKGSDIEWGDGDSDIDKISNGLGDMTVDQDLDPAAMARFANSMSASGMEHTRIDDLEIDEQIRIEDEDEDEGSEDDDEDSEVEAIMAAEEDQIIGELGSDDEDESDEDDISSDEDDYAFEAQLAKIRENAYSKKGKGTDLFNKRLSRLQEGLKGSGSSRVPGRGSNGYSDIDEALTWAERDEGFLDDIEDILDDNADTLYGRDRSSKKSLFDAIRNGDFSSLPAKKRRDYGDDLPPDLQARWEKDRLKKAENKRKRAATRLEAALDPFAQHKGGKKGRKAMIRASKLMAEAQQELDFSSSGRGSPAGFGSEFDIPGLIQRIRAYVSDLGNRGQMTLPPMDKTLRKQVHEIAAAFGLKSQSKGEGAGRYTTLSKTTRTGIRIDEAKIGRIMRSRGKYGYTRPGNPGFREKGKRRAGPPKHREGDEVGKEAPKIGETNVGFQLLTKLGWMEGDRIGVSGGLDAPLTAIIKNTKLGLGATR